MAGDDADLCTIGEFSRLVGVSPSALRYYDDCGLLVPARVDARTGYRFYARAQQRRAVAIRLLRAAGLPLREVLCAVDTPAEAAGVIAAHRERMAAEARTAAAALRAAVRLLEAAEATVTVPGPQLASGVRQVTPAADRSGGHGALAGVLVDITPDEVRLVASDRFRLAVRGLPVLSSRGGAAGTVVAVPALRRLIPALLRADAVDLRAGPGGLTCVAGGEEHVLATCAGDFPAYRVVLDEHPPPGDARAVVARDALLAALDPPRAGRVVRLAPAAGGGGAGGGAVVGGGVSIGDARAAASRTLPGWWTGRDLAVGFDAEHLAAAVAAGVGPDVIIDLAGGPLPSAVRSADHGSFMTLVMPRGDGAVATTEDTRDGS